MNRHCNLFAINLFAVLALGVTGCYKQDTSTLLSRQYDIDQQIKTHEKRIQDIEKIVPQLNEAVKSLKDLYAKVGAKEPVISVKPIYDKNDSKRQVAAELTFGVRTHTIGEDGKEKVSEATEKLLIPFGEKGSDGTTPTIEISEDGFWTINGKKTAFPAKVNEPLFSAGGYPKELEAGKSEEELKALKARKYWYVTFDSKSAPTWIKDEKGQPTPAEGKDGKLDNFPIREVKPSDDGQKLEIITNTKESSGDGYVTYLIPFSALTFSLNLESVTEASSTVEGKRNLITFDELSQEIEIPIEVSKNVKSIAMDLPSGWKGSVDLQNKKIKLRSPLRGGMSISDYEGIANFFAQDKEGKSTVSSVQVRLNKYLYLRYYHHLRLDRPFESPASTNNQIEINGKQTAIVQLWKLDPSSNQYSHLGEEKKITGEAEQKKIFKNDLGLRIPFSELQESEHIAAVTFLYDPTTLNKVKLHGANGKQEIDIPLSQALELRKLDADKVPAPLKRKKYKAKDQQTDEEQDYVLPCSRENYVVYNTVEIVEKSVQINSRIRRATTSISVVFKDFKKSKEKKNGENPFKDKEFDITKLYMTLSNVSTRILATNRSNDRNVRGDSSNTFLFVDHTHFSYDKEKDLLTGTFYCLGTENTESQLRFYYDDKFFYRWTDYGNTGGIPYQLDPEWGAKVYVNTENFLLDGSFKKWSNPVIVANENSGKSSTKNGWSFDSKEFF